VLKLFSRGLTAAFAPGTFDGGDSGDWLLVERIPETKVVSVAGKVTNAYGDSPIAYVCTTGNADHGLVLTSAPPGSTPRTVVSTTNADITLSGGAQRVDVVATSVDCVIHFPPEASMPGDDITVCLSPGSTHNALLRWYTGDTGQGSSADYTLSTAGTSVTFEA
jgi:hypothetical protein